MVATVSVTFGVEWNAADQVSTCTWKKIALNANLAINFMTAMQDHKHERKFAWGDRNAWANDFEHPQVRPHGQSLDWADDVHMLFFAGHGMDEAGLALASDPLQDECEAYYEYMRLGVKNLRWLLLAICGAVIDAGDSVTRVWSTPTDGDAEHPRQSLHIVGAFIGDQYPAQHPTFSADFAISVSAFGHPIGNAWLDAGFSRGREGVNQPIAIGFGRNEAEAIAVRDRETLAARNHGPVEANWLAWKWRS